MIKRTLYQFDLFCDDDESRCSIFDLANTLDVLLPQATVYAESAKTDIVVLRIEIEEGK